MMTDLEREFLQQKADGRIPQSTGWAEWRLQQVGHEMLRRMPEFYAFTSLGDCVSCDGYVLSEAETPYCPTCARLKRESAS